MKKKVVGCILTAMMITGMFNGCGNRRSDSVSDISENQAAVGGTGIYHWVVLIDFGFVQNVRPEPVSDSRRSCQHYGNDRTEYL